VSGQCNKSFFGLHLVSLSGVQGPVGGPDMGKPRSLGLESKTQLSISVQTQIILKLPGHLTVNTFVNGSGAV
jgi:hypothetical protein